MTKILYNGRVITPWRILENGYVLISDGKIEAVGIGSAPEADEKTDVEGQYIAPGFIDIHTHGAGGYDFMDGTVEDMLGAARAHLEHGTTTLLPTTVSAANEQLMPVLEAFNRAKTVSHTGAELYGLHLEGPYFSMEQKGAMDPKYVRNPDMAEVENVLSRSPYIVRWSIAPELPGALEMGRFLRRRGILPSVGHTMATDEETFAAIESGFTLCTHLYSAMPGVRRINAFRHAGPVEAAFVTDDMDVEIIADGCHLPSTLLRLIYSVKGPGRVALITDSMRAAGQDVTESILGAKATGLPVIVEDGVAKLPDRTAFAGSVATADRLVRTMTRLAGAPIQDAVRMMTATPARIMGMANKGRLAPGCDADVVTFGENVSVSRVYKGGELFFKAK